MKHHAVKKIISTSNDFVASGTLQGIWSVSDDCSPTLEETINHVTLRKRVWMTFGDGLAN